MCYATSYKHHRWTFSSFLGAACTATLDKGIVKSIKYQQSMRWRGPWLVVAALSTKSKELKVKAV